MNFALEGAQQFSSGQGHLHHVYEENVKGTTAICGKFVAFWVEFGDQLNSCILRKNLVGEWVLFEDSFTLGAFFFWWSLWLHCRVCVQVRRNVLTPMYSNHSICCHCLGGWHLKDSPFKHLNRRKGQQLYFIIILFLYNECLLLVQ